MIYTIGRILFRLFFKIFLRLEVYGRRNIPKNSAFILASNHVSFLDPPILGVSCDVKLNYMARDDLFNNRLFGRILKAVNCFPVKRHAQDAGALKEAVRRLKGGKPVVIFPEGTRSAGIELGSAKPGIGFLALSAGVPVIPAFIKGSERALGRDAKFIRLCPVKVYFGARIDASQYLKQGDKKYSYAAISARVMDEIKALKDRNS